CSNTASVTVTVNPSPTVTASQNGCSLEAVATGGTAPYISYTWTGPGSISGNGANFTPNPSTSGIYTVTVTDDKGCTATSTINFTNGNSIACCAPGFAL